MTSFTIIHTHTPPLWITGQKISKLEGRLFKIWFSLPVSLTKSFIYIALCKRSWRTDCILNSPLALIGSYTKSLYRTSEKQVNTHVILGLTPILEQTWKLVFIGQKLYIVSYYWGSQKGYVPLGGEDILTALFAFTFPFGSCFVLLIFIPSVDKRRGKKTVVTKL